MTHQDYMILFSIVAIFFFGLALFMFPLTMLNLSKKGRISLYGVAIVSVLACIFSIYQVNIMHNLIPQDGLSDEAFLSGGNDKTGKVYHTLMGEEKNYSSLHLLDEKDSSTMSLLHDDVAVERVRTIKKDDDKVLAELTLIDSPDNGYQIHKSFALLTDNQLEKIRYHIGLANDEINHGIYLSGNPDKHMITKAESANDLKEIQKMVQK